MKIKKKIEITQKEDTSTRFVVKMKCRECNHTEKRVYANEKMMNNLLLNATRCTNCQKFGTFLATFKIRNIEYKKAVITQNWMGKKKKLITINENSNNDMKLKKKIFPSHYTKSQLEKEVPYIGINNPKNNGIRAERFVDDNFEPVEVKLFENKEK